MDSIGSFLKLSSIANSINTIYTDSQNFLRLFQELPTKEIESFISHFIINNIPYVFKDKPILFEQIQRYLAKKFSISPHEIMLIGSAKNCFSISPMPNYGKPFVNSDLDFSICNSNVYEKLITEYFLVKEAVDFGSLTLSPRNSFFWKDSVEIIPRNSKRGFIDHKLIPNVEIAPFTRNISNSLWLIQTTILEEHGIKVKKPSIRVYKDYDSFIKVLSYNTTVVLQGL